VLGVTPQLGRAFTADDDRPARRGGDDQRPPVAHALRRRPGVVGRDGRAQRHPTTVVGVLPAGVRYPTARSDVWTPFAMSDSAWSAQRGNHQLGAVARLAPGVSLGRRAGRAVARHRGPHRAEYPDGASATSARRRSRSTRR
jgi:hypothetical protein